ncbi:hypothetical protein ACS0TY_001050 [Phlomoides rotata]
MATSVLVKQQVVIVPPEPTPNHILQLSALDSQLFLRFTSEVLLVYQPCNGVDRATIIDNVKSGLGQALVPYYPLAGRVRARADGSGLEVDCRGQGALFIEAVSNSTVPEFEGAPKQIDQWRKFLSLEVVDVLEGAPAFVLQLTWLSDGGVVLAVGSNHPICDGAGLGEFLNSFGEFAQGKLGLDKPKPIWSRHLLDPVLSGSTRGDSLSRHPEYGSVADLCGFATRCVREPLIPTSIVFDKNKIGELKKLAETTPTSFEVVSAHIWRCWVRALNLPSNQEVKLVFSMNIRNRVNPSLPSGYYGNAFVFGCAVSSVGDLIEKGLGYAAELVKKAKERVGDEYVREVVDSVSQDGANLDSVCALIMTQLSRLGLDVDFGIGKPIHMNPICPGKYCKLYPVSSAAASVKVNIAVLSSAVDQYLHLMENIDA